MSPRWGFGIATVVSPRRMIKCLPPGRSTNPSNRRRRIKSARFTGPKRGTGSGCAGDCQLDTVHHGQRQAVRHPDENPIFQYFL